MGKIYGGPSLIAAWLLAALGFSGSVLAQDATEEAGAAAQFRPTANECTYIVAQPGQRFTIPVDVKVGARLRFQRNVALVQVSIQNWIREQNGSSVWIRPTTDAEPTDEVGVTVFLEGEEEQNEFDFILKATETTDHSCTYVLDNRSAAQLFNPAPEEPDLSGLEEELRRSIAAAHSARRQAEHQAERTAARAEALQTAYTRQLQEMQRQFTDQANDAINAFRYGVNTGYSWSSGEVQFPPIVSAVYDDGRFTYIRLKDSSFGVPAITAKTEEDFYLVQYEYHDLTGVYTLQGLYDRLVLRFGTQEISIDRRS